MFHPQNFLASSIPFLLWVEISPRVEKRVKVRGRGCLKRGWIQDVAYAVCAAVKTALRPTSEELVPLIAIFREQNHLFQVFLSILNFNIYFNDNL